MGRVTFWFLDTENYVSVEAEEFHEDDGYIKAYNGHQEMVAMFKSEIIKGVYFTEQKTIK